MTTGNSKVAPTEAICQTRPTSQPEPARAGKTSQRGAGPHTTLRSADSRRVTPRWLLSALRFVRLLCNKSCHASPAVS